MTESVFTYPERLEIQPLQKAPHCSVRVPGSKSLTNRALILAGLAAAGRDCTLRGALHSEDTEVMVEALRALGFRVQTDWPLCTITVGRDDGQPIIPTAAADLYVANSGTTMRFLTAVICLGQGRYRLDGVQRMRERPIDDLLQALRQLGVDAASENGTGCPPVIVQGRGLRGGRAVVKSDVSSQFLSGLLLAAPFADGDTELVIDGTLVSEPYVAMTVEMMKRWGLRVEVVGSCYRISGRQRSGVQSYGIEPDASAASYFWAAAAITGGELRVADLTAHSLQGDVTFVDLLERMGCKVIRGHTGLTVRGGPLHGIEADMNAISDTVMTLAAVACFAEGSTTIRNVGHIRHKETDRLAALAIELRRIGADVEERTDGLTITPRPLHGTEIQTYNDHRMAMSLALVGLQIPGIVIANPGCVAKTYPGFFSDLALLRR